MSARVPVTLSDSDKVELRSRASAHKLSMSAFLRLSALGNRNAAADDPDTWWDSLPPSRKKQVRRWLTTNHTTAHVEGQMPLLEDLDEMGSPTA